MNKQKQLSGTHSLLLGKMKMITEEQQITQLIRSKLMLIEISYGSRESCTLPKANLVSTQSSFTHFPEVSTSKIIHHSFSLLSFSLLSPSSPALSLLISTLLATSLLSLPVTGNSHNCRPQSHPTSHPQCRRQRGLAGWVWMLSSSGSLSAASKQRMLLPHL